MWFEWANRMGGSCFTYTKMLLMGENENADNNVNNVKAHLVFVCLFDGDFDKVRLSSLL